MLQWYNRAPQFGPKGGNQSKHLDSQELKQVHLTWIQLCLLLLLVHLAIVTCWVVL